MVQAPPRNALSTKIVPACPIPLKTVPPLERRLVAELPTSFGRELRACVRCHLIKTHAQFTNNGCENCPFFQPEAQALGDYTSPVFSGLVSSMEPSGSWVAKWLSMGKLVPGCYAISVTGELSEELQTLCANLNVKY